MKDELGTRIKDQYEGRTRYSVPRRTYTIIRLDGKAFHSYTKHLKKPFDYDLSSDLDNSVISVLSEIQGAKFAYCQSDEISILLTDFEKPTTQAWFDGNIQKMASVSASLMTAHFNKLRIKRRGEAVLDKCKKEQGKNFDAYFGELLDLVNLNEDIASFDSRIFTIPDRTEVMNYFLWRNNDCTRNSVSMVAQANFPHRELQGKSSSQMQEMLFSQKKINWAETPEADKNGRLILKEHYLSSNNPDSERSRWVSKPAWKFTKDKRLLDLIPEYK